MYTLIFPFSPPEFLVDNLTIFFSFQSHPDRVVLSDFGNRHVPDLQTAGVFKRDQTTQAMSPAQIKALATKMGRLNGSRLGSILGVTGVRIWLRIL